jgi:hypothetical protein
VQTTVKIVKENTNRRMPPPPSQIRNHPEAVRSERHPACPQPAPSNQRFLAEAPGFPTETRDPNTVIGAALAATTVTSPAGHEHS